MWSHTSSAITISDRLLFAAALLDRLPFAVVVCKTADPSSSPLSFCEGSNPLTDKNFKFLRPGASRNLRLQTLENKRIIVPMVADSNLQETLSVMKKLKHVEVPFPSPKKEEVLSKLEAAALNPVDWKIQKGLAPPYLPSKFSFILFKL